MRGTGRVVFAAVLLLIAGTVNVIYGIGAIGDGMELVFGAANPGTRVAYLRMPGEAGLLLEFIQGQGMREMVRAGIAATNHWDGSDPVHVIDFAA